MIAHRPIRLLALCCVASATLAFGRSTADYDDALPAVSLQDAVQIASDYVAHKRSSGHAAESPEFQPFISQVRLVGFGSPKAYWEVQWQRRGRRVFDGDFTLGVAMDRSVRVIDLGK